MRPAASPPNVRSSPPVVEDQDDGTPATSTNGRVLRSGSFSVGASFLRCAFRIDIFVPNRLFNVGFRLARTFPPESPDSL